MTMHSRKAAFTWCLNQRDLRPPRGRPEAPFGPTSIEMIRTCGLRACFEGAFGADGWSGQQRHIMAVIVLTFTGEEGVLLRAADDEASDDVDDAHA